MRWIFNTLLEQTTELGSDWISRRGLLTVAAAHTNYSGETVLDALEYLVDEGYVEEQWDDRDSATQ